jgi:phage tail sheath protein FI
VALFSRDNNGVIIELPAVSGPTLSLTGSMVFGIGTQTNNALGSATQFSLDSNGYINTIFNGTVFSSYIDSGSNAYFFQDTIAQDNGWYTPSSTLTLSAIIGNNTDVSFSVGNADNMFNDYPTYAVFNTLAGYSNGYFGWGLPFFYGRNVYTSITPQGNGTYFAF